MNYWLNLFSEESWSEFVRNGSSVSGFRESRWAFARRVQVGDIMPCYMTGGRGFFGITEVTAEPFFDKSPRWEGFDFAAWIPLKVSLLLPDDAGIRPPDLKELSWIKGKPGNHWVGRVRAALAPIEDADGEIIVSALNQLLLD